MDYFVGYWIGLHFFLEQGLVKVLSGNYSSNVLKLELEDPNWSSFLEKMKKESCRGKLALTK